MNAARLTRRKYLRDLVSAGLGVAAARAGAATPRVWQLGGLWRDDQDRPVTFDAWRGRPALLTMAYGSCRRVCSTTLRLLQHAQAQADARGLDLEVVVVSLDPTVDTPAAWRQFRAERGLQRANWHFLGGSPALTRRVAALLELRYWVYDEHVLHDFRIAAVDPAGRIVARMDWVDDPVDALLDALAAR